MRETGGQRVTVVIPTKNEEETLGEIIEGVKPFCDEVLVVDGFSTDRTRDIATCKGARLELDGGKGKGDGIRTGIEKASGDIVVFIDADGSHDPADIPMLLEPIVNRSMDMIIASRMKGGSDELYGTLEEFFRLVGSMIITLSINYRFKVRLTDSQNGFRAIRKQVAESLCLSENTHAIEGEMVIKCLKKKFRVGEVASHEYRRKAGQSKINLWRDSHQFVWTVVKNIF